MKKSTAFLMISLVVAGATPSFAATDAEWEKFAKDVRVACIKAAAPLFEKAKAVVDPNGSESYGLALLRGKAKGAAANIQVICVYDKKAKKAEVGGELPLKAAQKK